MELTEAAIDALSELPVAEQLGFWNKQEGAAFALQLLAALDKPVPDRPWLLPVEERNKVTTRESLEKTARELAIAGLKGLAKAATELAARRPSKLALCPYEPNTTNAKAWLFRERQEAGLCPWCGSERTAEQVCDNGQTCAERWQDLCARAPKP